MKIWNGSPAAAWTRFMFGSILATLAAGDATGAVTNPKVAAAITEARASAAPSIDELRERLEPLDAPTVVALRTALLDADPFVRQTAVALLGRVEDPCARLMCRLLKDDIEAVRAAAEQALVELGPPAVASLGETLLTESPSSDAKVRAARALGRIGAPEGIPFLIETLRKFQHGGFRTDLVCESLARIGQPAARELIEHLRFPSIREDVYLALLLSEPGVVRAEMLALARDVARAPEERALYATEAEKILGTKALYDDLLAVYKDLTVIRVPTTNGRKPEELMSAGLRWEVLRKRTAAEYLSPLTLAGVRSSFAVLREQEFQREQAEDRRRQSERQSRPSAKMLAIQADPEPAVPVESESRIFKPQPYKPSPEALAAGKEYQRLQWEEKARNLELLQNPRY